MNHLFCQLGEEGDLGYWSRINSQYNITSFLDIPKKESIIIVFFFNLLLRMVILLVKLCVLVSKYKIQNTQKQNQLILITFHIKNIKPVSHPWSSENFRTKLISQFCSLDPLLYSKEGKKEVQQAPSILGVKEGSISKLFHKSYQYKSFWVNIFSLKSSHYLKLYKKSRA